MTESWMVRAGQGADLIDDFIEQKMVTIGWQAIGDLTEVTHIEEIKRLLRDKCGYTQNASINIIAGQINRFKNEIVPDQIVVTYDPSQRFYWVGKIISEYIYDENIEGHRHPHKREVEWLHSISRDRLSSSAKNTLGAISTIFKISESVTEELLNPHAEYDVAEESAVNLLEEDIEIKALESIKDKLVQLDWEELQDLVAGVLRAMGYKTLVSPKGPDRGKDIVASPDGLGLEEPKIVVEVKHRTQRMGAQEIRSLLGGLRGNSKALFVSTGGFSKDAKYEAERAHHPLTLIDIDLLVELITQYYDNFDSATKTLLPLKKVYWPL